MTIFKFRDFEHPVSEVNLLSHDMQQTYSNRGHQFRRIEVFTTEVVICTTGQSNFDTELSELRTGYGFDGLAGPPLAGEGATNELRSQGKPVFFVSAGVQTGTGEAPAFLAPAIVKANEIGLPALVLMAGDTITKAINLPATKDAILAEVK